MVTKGAAGAQEEQGFNEKELEDIMSEIESLESDSGDADEGCEPAAQCAVEGEEVEEEVPVTVKKATPVRPKVVEEVRSSDKPARMIPNSPKEVSCSMPSQMEFRVQGDMQMNLKFYVGETWVQFTANPSEGLVIEMPGGMRFSLPVSSMAAQKTKKVS